MKCDLPGGYDAGVGTAMGMGVPWAAGTMLAFEACEVIHLRLAKLAIGDASAEREAHLMVNEKINASFEACMNWLSGASAASIVDRYRQHVAANAKRLSA
jgi:hypothetical protein